MKPIDILLMGPGYGKLDRQSIVSGGDGTAPVQDRRRGYSGVGGLGSITDGTSNIFGGASIDQLYWDENGGTPKYVLQIVGATDGSWTTMRIVGTNGTKVLDRASRTTFGSNTWTWTTGDFLGVQAFGGIGDNVTVYFD